MCKYTVSDIDRIKEILQRKNNIEGTPTPDDLIDFNQIREVAETILISAHEPSLVPVMNSLLRDVITSIAKDLSSDIINMGQIQLLSRIFMLDE